MGFDRTQKNAYQPDFRTLALYHLNESTTGVMADASPNGFDGTIGSSCTAGVAAKFDKGATTPAVDADASNLIVTDVGVIDILLRDDELAEFGVEFWMAGASAGIWADASDYIIAEYEFEHDTNAIHRFLIEKLGASGEIQFTVTYKGSKYVIKDSIPQDILDNDTIQHHFLLNFDAKLLDDSKLESWVNSKRFAVETLVKSIETLTGTNSKLSFGNTFNATFDEIRISKRTRNPLRSKRIEIVEQLENLLAGITKKNGFVTNLGKDGTISRTIRHVEEVSANEIPFVAIGISNNQFNPEVSNVEEELDFLVTLDLLVNDSREAFVALDDLLTDVQIAIFGKLPDNEPTNFEKVSLQGLSFLTSVQKQSWFTDDGQLALDGLGAWGRLHLKFIFETSVIEP